MGNINLTALRRASDFYEVDAPAWVRALWPTRSSFDWFIKSRRAQLVEHGGLVKLGSRVCVDTDRFQQAAQMALQGGEVSQ